MKIKIYIFFIFDINTSIFLSFFFFFFEEKQFKRNGLNAPFFQTQIRREDAKTEREAPSILSSFHGLS